jgi:beta-glucanase (GH16 family)
MKKAICSLLFLFLFSSDTFVAKGQKADDREWKLVFSDEFNQKNGSQPDSTKWSFSTRVDNGWAQWISHSKKVVFIKNGKLVCRAIPNNDRESDYVPMLTGAVETKDKFSFQYGKVEVRMRTNLKQGNFPAAWMVPDYKLDKRYGEIDIVEMFGNEGKAAHNVHTHRSYNLKKEGIKREFKEVIDVTKWHVYGVVWTANKIVWTVDGNIVGEYSKIDTPQMISEGQWTFDRPFFLRLNQSVGNSSHPLLVPDFGTTYETQFDWIRVYQKSK